MRVEIFFLILGMGLVTFFSRFVPMMVLTRRILPDGIKRGLELLPLSIISAIVFPLLFFNGEGKIGMHLPSLLTAIPVVLFAWKVKSLWGSVLLGMVIYWAMGFIF
ncbi:MAG: AzlD domain-containing protein [Thermodesulfobacteriota bacterium]